MVHFLTRRIEAFHRGVTLIELLFVCGFFAMVLTMFLVLMGRTVTSQKQLDQVTTAAVNLEVGRLKLTELLGRSRLVAPVFAPAVPPTPGPGTSNRLTLTLFAVDTTGDPLLDALGQPQLGNTVDVELDADNNLVYTDGAQNHLLAPLGGNALFEVERLSLSRIRVRLEVDGHEKTRRSLVFEAAAP